jgi:hypothetical protein
VTSAAWKDLERRVCVALGARRRPSAGAGGWARGSDDDGSAAFAVEVKRTKRLQLRQAWVDQARRNAKRSGRPWLLVMSEHRSRRPVAVLDFWQLVELAQRAGVIPELDVVTLRDDPDPEGAAVRETPEPTPDEPTPEGDDGDEGGA